MSAPLLTQSCRPAPRSTGHQAPVARIYKFFPSSKWGNFNFRTWWNNQLLLSLIVWWILWIHNAFPRKLRTFLTRAMILTLALDYYQSILPVFSNTSQPISQVTALHQHQSTYPQQFSFRRVFLGFYDRWQVMFNDTMSAAMKSEPHRFHFQAR